MNDFGGVRGSGRGFCEILPRPRLGPFRQFAGQSLQRGNVSFRVRIQVAR